MLLILLILFFISFFMFYFSYLFSVLFLMFLVMLLMLVSLSGMMYVKYLVVLVYISGVVVFILYISCMCWNISSGYSKWFLLFGIFIWVLFDLGVYSKFSDVSEFLWMFFFFSFLFNSLIMGYSMNLFKVSGSLRF